MATSHESLSKQSRRRTSWIFAIMGLIILILFLMVLCSRNVEVQEVEQEDDSIGLTRTSTLKIEPSSIIDVPKFDKKEDGNYLQIETSYFKLFYSKNQPLPNNTSSV